MNKIELEKFIDEHRDTIGPVNIVLNKKFFGQFALGYYFDEDSDKYKVYEVNERQNVWIRDAFSSESAAIERLYRLVKTTFWIK